MNSGNSLVAVFFVSALQIVGAEVPAPRIVRLADERLRDSCIWPDESTKTYYLVSASNRRGPNSRPAVVAYTSKDLELWEGPRVIFEIPEDFWTKRGIWAPELHAYRLGRAATRLALRRRRAAGSPDPGSSRSRFMPTTADIPWCFDASTAS